MNTTTNSHELSDATTALIDAVDNVFEKLEDLASIPLEELVSYAADILEEQDDHYNCVGDAAFETASFKINMTIFDALGQEYHCRPPLGKKISHLSLFDAGPATLPDLGPGFGKTEATAQVWDFDKCCPICGVDMGVKTTSPCGACEQDDN